MGLYGQTILSLNEIDLPFPTTNFETFKTNVK